MMYRDTTLGNASDAAVVTPNDNSDLPRGACRGIWVNDNAVVNVSVIPGRGAAAVVFSVYGPGLINTTARRIRATGTTATSILALY